MTSARLPYAVLQKVADAGCFPDSKTFVDKPITTTRAAALDALSSACCAQEVCDAVSTHFGHEESELQPWCPPDWQPEPPALRRRIADAPTLRFVLRVHALWPQLFRQCRPGPDSSLLPLPHAIAIAGQRFRESYYWDSLWVVKGLLAADMVAAAKGLVYNFFALVNRYGFVPNGSREYYLNRSQPPLLSAMVAALLSACDAADPSGRDGDALLADALPALLREHAHWTGPPKAVALSSRAGRRHVLSRYYAATDAPRAESFREDVELAAGLGEGERRRLWRDVASAAESGWDFSSRWCSLPTDLATIRTTSIVPVDLNAFLWGLERDVAAFAGRLRQSDVAAEFAQRAAARGAAVADLMWDDAAAHWHDLLLLTPGPESDAAPEGSRGSAPSAECLGRDGNSHEPLRQGPAHADPSGRAGQASAEAPAPMQRGAAAAQTNTVNVATPRDQPLADAPSTAAHSTGGQGTSDLPAPPRLQATGTDAASWTTEFMCAQLADRVTVACYTPLLYGMLSADAERSADASAPGAEAARVRSCVESLRTSGLIAPGGVLTSLRETGQQWDAPNCWPPLQCMLVEGLQAHGGPEGRALGRTVGEAFLAAAHKGLDSSGAMWEKYHGHEAGVGGRGGEYDVQVGFGWTNGSVVHLAASCGICLPAS